MNLVLVHRARWRRYFCWLLGHIYVPYIDKSHICVCCDKVRIDFNDYVKENKW